MEEQGFYTHILFIEETMKISLRKINLEDLYVPQEQDFRHLLPRAQYLSIEAERNSLQQLDQLQRFFASLPKIENLKGLKISVNSGNNFLEQGYIDISNFITSNNKNLTSLDLKIHFKQIKEQGAEYLAQCLLQLSSLENLTLELGSENNIKTQGCHFLGIALSQLKNLKKLSLSIGGLNNIQGEGAANLLKGLKYLSLEYLKFDLFPNEINQQGFVEISKELTQIQSLTDLDLSIILQSSEAVYHVEGFKSLGFNLPKLEKLKVFQFQYFGPINIDQADYLVQHMHQLKHLEVIKMNLLPYPKTISNAQIDTFLQSLSKCKVLNKLHICLPNCIFSVSSKFKEEIQIPFENLLNFEFKIGNAPLSQESSNVIGEQIGKMIKLEDLNISIRNNSEASDLIIQNLLRGVEQCSYLQSFHFDVGSQNKVQLDGVNCLLELLRNKYHLIKLNLLFASGNKLLSSSFDKFQEVSQNLSSLKSLTLVIKENEFTSQDISKIKGGLQNLKELKQFNFTISGKNNDPNNVHYVEENDLLTLNLGELFSQLKQIEILKFSYLQYQTITLISQNNIFNGINSGLSNLKVLHLKLKHFTDFNRYSCLLLQQALSKCTSLLELDLKLYGRSNQDKNDIKMSEILNDCNSLIVFTFQIQYYQQLAKLKKNAMKKKRIVIINQQ